MSDAVLNIAIKYAEKGLEAAERKSQGEDPSEEVKRLRERLGHLYDERSTRE